MHNNWFAMTFLYICNHTVIGHPRYALLPPLILPDPLPFPKSSPSTYMNINNLPIAASPETVFLPTHSKELTVYRNSGGRGHHVSPAPSYSQLSIFPRRDKFSWADRFDFLQANLGTESSPAECPHSAQNTAFYNTQRFLQGLYSFHSLFPLIPTFREADRDVPFRVECSTWTYFHYSDR